MNGELTLSSTDWAAMPDAERGVEIPRLVAQFRRRALNESWDIGRALQAHKNVRTGRDWRAYLDSIGMERNLAIRLVKIATVESAQLEHFESESALLKTLKPAPEPQSETSKSPLPEPTPPEPDKPTVAEANAAMNAAAAEHEEQRDPAAEREARDERLSVRLENSDGEAVEALAGQLDKADTRHHDDVGAVNDARKAAAVERRKNRESATRCWPYRAAKRGMALTTC